LRKANNKKNGQCRQQFCLRYLNFGCFKFVSYFSTGHLTVDIRILKFLLSCLYFSVYKRSCHRCGKAVVYVDHGDAGGAAIEHGQKRRQSICHPECNRGVYSKQPAKRFLLFVPILTKVVPLRIYRIDKRYLFFTPPCFYLFLTFNG